MNTIRKIGLMIFFMSAIGGAFAQETGKLKMKLNYNIAMPVESMKSDYISNTSFRGASGEIGYWFNSKFALGLGVGYQTYYQRYARQLYKLDNDQTISAVVTNTLELMPVTVNGTFVPMAGSGSLIQPYITVGAGLNLINYRQYLGEFSDSKPNSGFIANAGAGIMIPVSKKNGTNLQFGASYTVAPYNKNGLSSLNNIGVNAGIVFPIK